MRACVQYKLSDCRAKLPARGSLRTAMLEVVQVPAMSAFSDPQLTWWGELNAARDDAAMKSLWRLVDKSKLPDQTIAPAFPGAPGSKAHWEAQKQELVDGYNAGQVADQFVHVGKWPNEVDELRVYPGLRRIAKQQPLVMRAPPAPWLLRINLTPGCTGRRLWAWFGGQAGHALGGRSGGGNALNPYDPLLRMG